jgi:hypothetical protein
MTLEIDNILTVEECEVFWLHIASVVPLIVLAEIVALELDQEYARKRYGVYSATARAVMMAKLASRGLSAVPA